MATHIHICSVHWLGHLNIQMPGARAGSATPCFIDQLETSKILQLAAIVSVRLQHRPYEQQVATAGANLQPPSLQRLVDASMAVT